LLPTVGILYAHHVTGLNRSVYGLNECRRITEWQGLEGTSGDHL